jgi:hypothetical protein
MKSWIVGQLGVEGGGEHTAFADRDRVAVVAGQHLDRRAEALHPGGADEHRPQRLVADPLDLELRLEALQLAPEGVAASRSVDEAEVVGVADDQAGAGAEDRPPGLVVGAQRRLQAGGLDPLADRRALAAGDDEAVEALEVGGSADLGYVGAEPAQRAGVGLEVPLQR